MSEMSQGQPSEADLRGKVNRGDHAQRILDDPLVKEVLENMRQTVYYNIATSNFKQVEERENLYLMLKAIEGFEREFKDAINGGKKAQSRLINLLKGGQNDS